MEASRRVDSGHGVGGLDRSGVRIPPPLFYVAGFVAGVVLELPFPTGALPLALAILAGIVGGALWLALDGSAMLLFRRAGTSVVPMRPTTALVTSGPYRFTRNPMYVGMAVLYLALALSFGVIWALALLPAILYLVDRLVVVREERYLEAKFGENYREYKKRVRRWL